MRWIAGCALGVALVLAPASAREAAAPPKAADLWLVPDRVGASDAQLAAAVKDLVDGKAAAALPVLVKAANAPGLGPYVRLYRGRAALALNQIADARAIGADLADAPSTGYLREASLMFAASVAEAADDAAGALKYLNAAVPLKPSSSSTVWLRIGRAAVKSSDRAQAITALTKVYFEYPLSDDANEAAKDLAAPGMPGVAVTAENYARAKARAVALFDARRFTDARKAIEAARPFATSDDRDLFALRLAQIDLNTKKYAAALDGLAPFSLKGPRRLEAQFGTLIALRGLGRTDDYVSQTRAFIAANPDSTFADDALNELGSYYTTTNDDAKAAEVFGELYDKFPSGLHAERAAWKAGWWAYKVGNYPETARVFDDAAVRMAHADTRPSWLYWAAKAHQRAGDREAAVEGFRKTISYYRNLYYGREAARELKALASATPAKGPAESSGEFTSPQLEFQTGAAPANAAVITRLLEAGMWDDALGELRYAERAAGTSPLIQATQAYAWSRKGDLRMGITLMKRAYPQFMAAGGEVLPDQILQVIYPVAYWDLITQYATAHKLDPAIMAALIAQESSFQADVKSAANAWGLMQIVPATGRQYAAHLGIRPFSTVRLTEPAVNIRIGMAYFAELTKQFDLPAALASYNAGENRAARWIAERPGLARDEFIDDIPFPETQGYVRRIIGTAEDYRRLYPAPATPAKR